MPASSFGLRANDDAGKGYKLLARALGNAVDLSRLPFMGKLLPSFRRTPESRLINPARHMTPGPRPSPGWRSRLWS